MRTALLALAMAGGPGCYSYSAVAPGAVPVGSHVRVQVRPGAELHVGSLALPDRAPLRGRVDGYQTPDTLLLGVALDPSSSGTPSRGLRGAVALPLSDIERVELRRLDRVRTGASVGALVLLGAAVLDLAFDIRNAREGTDDPGGVDNARIVLLRWRW